MIIKSVQVQEMVWRERATSHYMEWSWSSSEASHPCIPSSLWVKVILAIGNHKNTENKRSKRSSIWQLCLHWWHHKLSLWQLTVPPVTTTLSNWRSFVFSEYSKRDCCPVLFFDSGCTQHSLVVPFWRPLEGSSIPLFSYVTSPHDHRPAPSRGPASQLAMLSHWLTLSTKDITTSFWYYNKWFWFLSDQIMGLYNFSNPTE